MTETHSDATTSIVSSDISRDFVRLMINPPLTLGLMDFVQDIDCALSPSLPNRIDHIAGIVEQAFGIGIEKHRLLDYITMMKITTGDGNFILKHKKNLNDEMMRYSLNPINICKFPTSAPFCRPIVLETLLTHCPQFVCQQFSRVKSFRTMFLIRCHKQLNHRMIRHRIVRLFAGNGDVSDAVVVSFICKSSKCNLEIYPNFIANLDDDPPRYAFTTHRQFSHGKYVFLGGRVGFDRSLFRQYSSLLM